MTSRYGNNYQRNYRNYRYNRNRNTSFNSRNYNGLTNSYSSILGFLKPKSRENDIFKGTVYPPLDKYYYNLLANQRGYNPFLLKYALRRNLTTLLKEHFKDLVVNKRNFIALIVGKSGLGKSLIGLGCYYYLRKYHYRYKNKETKIHFTFNYSKSKRKIKKMNEGDLLLQDENNKEIGLGSKTGKIAFENLINSFRYTQKSLIVCNPDYYYIPNLHIVLSPLGHDEHAYKTEDPEDMRTRVLIRFIDDTLQTKKPVYLGYAWIPIGKIAELFKEYEKAKKKNYEYLEKHEGMRSAKIDEKQFQENVKDLLKIAEEQNYTGKSKSDLKSYLIRFSSINADTDTTKFIINETYKQWHKIHDNIATPKSEELQERIDIDYEKEFHVSHEDILMNMKEGDVQWYDLDRDIMIFEELKRGRYGKDIAQEFELSEGQISIIKNKVQGYVNTKRGELYEIYYEKRLGLKDKYQEWEIKRDGRKSQPDIYCISPEKNELHVFSIKCYELYRTSYSIPVKELKPEIQFCLKNHHEYDKIKLYNISFDHIDKKIYKHEIDYLNPPKTIKLKKE